MPAPIAFARETGHGPPVVCLHSNAASSAQWRDLMERLAPRHRVIAPDSYGAGKTAAWAQDRRLQLADEVALIEPWLDASTPAWLIGHSYGAAIALKAALMRPERVRALVVYEPTFFSLIEQSQPAPNAADGIRDAALRSGAAVRAGDLHRASHIFIDYWMGQGSWAGMPPERQSGIAAAISNVLHWWPTLITEPTPLAQFANLDMPVLLMLGEQSTASAHGVVDHLVQVLPQVECVRLPGLGHMGPLTHPAVVNPIIERFMGAHGAPVAPWVLKPETPPPLPPGAAPDR